MTPAQLLDAALTAARRQDATPEVIDHANARLEVLTHDPIPDLTKALRKVAEPYFATRRRSQLERWHRLERA